jgi:thioredoxin 1
MNTFITLTAGNFDTEVLASPVPVLVKFSAPWCGKCRALTTMISQIMADFEGKVKFAELDIEAEEALRDKYEISSVPVLMLYKNGEAADKKSGMLSKQQIIDFLRG